MTTRRNTRKSDSPDHADILAQDDANRPEAAELGATDEATAALMARIAELEAALAARRPVRKGLTPKQRRFVAYVTEHPEADIATACVEAGATATSHGFVFRMIEEGVLAFSVTDHGRELAGQPTSSDTDDNSGDTDDTDTPVTVDAAAQDA